MRYIKLLTFGVLSILSLSAFGQDTLEMYDYTEKGEFEIGGVDVVGAETRDKNAIRSITGLTVGRKIEMPG